VTAAEVGSAASDVAAAEPRASHVSRFSERTAERKEQHRSRCNEDISVH
jgi:hypothetical protein